MLEILWVNEHQSIVAPAWSGRSGQPLIETWQRGNLAVPAQGEGRWIVVMGSGWRHWLSCRWRHSPSAQERRPPLRSAPHTPRYWRRATAETATETATAMTSTSMASSPHSSSAGGAAPARRVRTPGRPPAGCGTVAPATPGGRTQPVRQPGQRRRPRPGPAHPHQPGQYPAQGLPRPMRKPTRPPRPLPARQPDVVVVGASSSRLSSSLDLSRARRRPTVLNCPPSNSANATRNGMRRPMLLGSGRVEALGYPGELIKAFDSGRR